MVAGEASGDLLAAHLIAALRQHLPDAHFFGIGGPRMQSQGFDAWWPAETLAVRGYAEVVRHYRKISGVRRRLARRLLAAPPDIFVGVDAPDFNLGLEKRLKSAGITTVHYVSPSVWAWRGGRIRRIGESVSRILALFPFEPALYARRGIPVSYVGHPLADVIPVDVDRAAARQKLDIPQATRVIALLPGSRQSELHFMAETFIDAARLLAERDAKTQFLVPMASRETRQLFEAAMDRRAARDLPISVLFGHAQDALAAADVALVASGTATLEAALLKTPMVIAYRISAWSYAFMRHMAYLPWIGLPNVLAGRFVVPEFIQHDATAENLAQAVANIAEDRVIRERLRGVFREIHLSLRQNNAERAAAAILPHLGMAGSR